MDYRALLLGIAVNLAVLAICIWLMLPHHAIHPLGLNSTRLNNTTCQYTWLGGTDYESFVDHIAVNGANIGHPPAMSVIHTGDCSATVDMWMRDVRTYVRIYP